MPSDIQATIDKSVRQRETLDALVADYCSSVNTIDAYRALVAERDATIADLNLQIVALKSQIEQAP